MYVLKGHSTNLAITFHKVCRVWAHLKTRVILTFSKAAFTSHALALNSDYLVRSGLFMLMDHIHVCTTHVSFSGVLHGCSPKLPHMRMSKI